MNEWMDECNEDETNDLESFRQRLAYCLTNGP